MRIGNVVPGGPGAVAAQGDAVWVAPSSGLLTRLDAATGRVVAAARSELGPRRRSLSATARVWLTDSEGDNVTRVDPTGLLTPIAVGNGPSGIAVGDGGVWVADSLDNAVVRIDPDHAVGDTTIPVGHSPAGVAVGAGSVWVANSGDGTVTRIDPRTDKVIATIAVGGSPQAITVADGRAWVTVDAQTIAPTDLAAGGGTLRIDSELESTSMDPALAVRRPVVADAVRDLREAPELPGQARPGGLAADARRSRSRCRRARPTARPTRSRSAPASASRRRRTSRSPRRRSRTRSSARSTRG